MRSDATRRGVVRVAPTGPALQAACPTCGAGIGAPCVSTGRWPTPIATPKGQPIQFFHIARRRAVWGAAS